MGIVIDENKTIVGKSSYTNDTESQKFRSWLSQFQFSEKTVVKYNIVRKKMLEKYKNPNQADINNFLAKHPTQLYYFAIKKWLEYASRNDLWLNKKFKFRPRKKRDVPTLEELNQIVQEKLEGKINNDCLWILKLQSKTGLRIDEALALTLNNISRERRRITFTTKGGYERMAQLPEAFYIEFIKYLTEIKALLGNERLFFTNTANTASAYRAFRDCFDKFRPDPEIEMVLRTHNFRRAIINKIIDMRGISAAQAFIGHRRITTTQRYESEQQEERERNKGFEIICGESR